MAEYITKEQAINVVNVAFGHVYDSDSTTVCLVDLQNEIIMTIEQNTEPADVAPIEYASWIEDDYGYARCDFCGYEIAYPEYKTPRCPGCGARMEGDQDA